MMARSTSRGGFTLVELMVTVSIFAVVSASLASAFVGGVRLLKSTFATAEMSLGVRALRERLLFNAAPPHDGTVWAGLLSGTNSTDVLEGNATKILMHCAALKNANGVTANQTIQLIFKNPGSQTCSFFSEDRYDERWSARWLHPNNLDLFANSAQKPPLAWARKEDDTEDHSRFYIYLSGYKDVAGLPVEHNERIVVPVFGRRQITRLDGKGGLDR